MNPSTQSPQPPDCIDVECAIVGAGVVGLAVARALAIAGREVVVLEAADAFGTGISSRNSEVIHAGIYYRANSLKARLCVQGRQALYGYCQTHHIPFKRCGKIIVATNGDQRAQLETIEARARANGVDDLRFLQRADLCAFEPHLEGVAGLLSPSTGIIDSHALMMALLGEAEAHGAMLALATPVIGGAANSHGLAILTGGASGTRIVARIVVLSAGLAAPSVAATIEGIDRNSIPQAHFSKGNYFSVSRRVPFSRLIYPVPEPGGLGIHLTLDLAGQARFGPDVEWLSGDNHESINYDVDSSRAKHFYDSIRLYWPQLGVDELQPAYSGVRPKIVGPGSPDGDFAIHDQSVHGVTGLIALYGIESPGLTSALAIGDHIAELIDRA